MSDIALHIATSPVTRALDVIGDRWAVLIMRDAFQGVRRFEEFRARTGATRATLTNRLKALVEQGLLERVRYREAPPRDEYRLTAAGRDLIGVALAAWRWERRWAPRGDGVPSRLWHERCGHATRPQLVCGSCGEPLDLRETVYCTRERPRRRSRSQPLLRRLSPSTARTHRGTSADMTYVADIMGDRWTPLVVSAAFFGQRRFEDIQQSLGIASNILAQRLEHLVKRGILRRRVYSRHPSRSEYRLTEKGRDLYPYAVALAGWGERWLVPRGGATAVLYHSNCGKRIVAQTRCDHCGGRVGVKDLSFRPTSETRMKKDTPRAHHAR